MARVDRHRCPIGGCAQMIDNDKLMCRLHWRHVSDATRAAVTKTWRAFLATNRARRSDDVKALARSQYERARDAALIEAARADRDLAGV